MADIEIAKAIKEDRGDLISGRLKLTDSQVIFKNQKTGKLDTLQANDFENIKWHRLGEGYCIRILTKNGQLYRYGGFDDTQQAKLEKFVKQNYSLTLEPQNFSIRGWNCGNPNFEGSVLNFEIKDNEKSFEIPLSNVSNCTVAKNEATIEMHQNDDVALSLVEMRFHIPSIDGVDMAQNFMEQVMAKASIIRDTGDFIASFDELHCLTPRGRYDIKIFPTYIQLHGKTFDYKIPISSVLRLFQLPEKETKMMFVLSLDPPMKQGQTRYHFLILVFDRHDETELELRMSESELASKYGGKLQKKMSGPVYQVFGSIVRSLVNSRILEPDEAFTKSHNEAVIYCTYKASYGLLYPLEKGFIYLHKPPVHIRFDEIASVSFARGGSTTKLFDFEITTKADMNHVFSSIAKETYPKLYDFVKAKGLRISNTSMEGSSKKKDKVAVDSDMEDSDDNDAYLHRVRQEGKIREAGDDDDDDSESEDEDFNPEAFKEDDVNEEFDSEAPDSSEDGSGSDDERPKKKAKKEKAKKEKTTKEKPKKEKAKKETAKKEIKEKSSKKSSKAASPTKSPTKGGFKSQEFIEDSDSSDAGSDSD